MYCHSTVPENIEGVLIFAWFDNISSNFVVFSLCKRRNGGILLNRDTFLSDFNHFVITQKSVRYLVSHCRRRFQRRRFLVKKDWRCGDLVTLWAILDKVLLTAHLWASLHNSDVIIQFGDPNFFRKTCWFFFSVERHFVMCKVTRSSATAERPRDALC